LFISLEIEMNSEATTTDQTDSPGRVSISPLEPTRNYILSNFIQIFLVYFCFEQLFLKQLRMKLIEQLMN
jgi:hypothetical protein